MLLPERKQGPADAWRLPQPPDFAGLYGIWFEFPEKPVRLLSV